MTPTRAQQLMINDGLPARLALDSAARAALWTGVIYTPPAAFFKAPVKKEEEAATKRLRADLAAVAAKKKAASLQRLQEWKIFNNRSLAKPELKPRADVPVTQQETAMATPKKTSAKKPVAKKSATAKVRSPAGERSRYDWKTAAEKAAVGTIPSKPDFSAPTHARFLPILEQITAACSAKDLKALKAIKISPISSTPKAMDRYRGLCVTALTA